MGVAAGVSSGVSSGMASGVTSDSGCDSWAVGASPAPKGEGWTLSQATWATKSFMLIMGRCWAKSWILCITRHKPWWRLSSIGTRRFVLWAEGLEGANAGASGVGAGGAEEERAEASGSLALVLRVPGNVIMGSSGFQ